MTRSAKLLAILAAGGIAAIGLNLPGTAQAQFYKGKTITIIVGYRPGSGIDLNAKVLARMMPKHVPGNPKIIAKNRPGGGTAAQNYMWEKAKPNGLQVVYGPWNPVGQITRNRALRARYDKVAMIGGGGSTRITWANTDYVPSPGKLVSASQRKGLNYGGSRVTGSIDLLARLGFDVLGVNYRVTFGYQQSASMRAMPQGEIQLATASLNNWIAYVVPSIERHKKAAALYYYPRLDAAGNAIRNKNTGKIPMYLDVYKATSGKAAPPASPEWNAMKWLLRMGTLSQTLWAPPGTPKEAVADLRTGFWKTVKSKEFLDLYYANYGAPMDYTDEKTVLSVVGSVEDASPEIRDFFKAYIKTGRTFKSIRKKRKGKKGKKKKGS